MAHLPSGLSIPGHIDLFEPGDQQYVDPGVLGKPEIIWRNPGYVADVKTKANISLIRTVEDVDRAHLFQIRLYHLALVQEGKIAPDAPAYLIYLDRSGKNPDPKVIEVPTREEYITEIDEWVGDAVYAVKAGEEASKDRPVPWCVAACPYAWDCRAGDTLANGNLIEDETQLRAVKAYIEGKELEKRSKDLIDAAKDALEDVSGTTPDGFVVAHTVIAGATYTTTRQPGVRLSIRRLK